jgi:hypothetical protein
LPEGVFSLSDESSVVDLRVLAFLPEELSLPSDVDSPVLPSVGSSPLCRDEVWDSPDFAWLLFPDLGEALAFASAEADGETLALGATLAETLGDADAPGETDGLAPGETPGEAYAPA